MSVELSQEEKEFLQYNYYNLDHGRKITAYLFRQQFPDRKITAAKWAELPREKMELNGASAAWDWMHHDYHPLEPSSPIRDVVLPTNSLEEATVDAPDATTGDVSNEADGGKDNSHNTDLERPGLEAHAELNVGRSRTLKRTRTRSTCYHSFERWPVYDPGEADTVTTAEDASS